jgi:hydroxymethylpyrimidine pyrophosphatase-like HAD family hydrolase
MGNASKRVQDAADVIVSSNDEDGVAEAIQRYVLKT